MSQHVTCPKCKHQFEVDELSERCERYVAKLTGGTLAPKNNPIIDVIGKSGETYQVKYSKGKSWHFEFSVNGIEPDFAALIGIKKHDRFLFLLPYWIVKRQSIKRKDYGNRVHRGHHGVDEIQLSCSTGLSSWIWDYRVSPENFMARVSELKASQQLAMGFTKGLGD